MRELRTYRQKKTLFREATSFICPNFLFSVMCLGVYMRVNVLVFN